MRHEATVKVAGGRSVEVTGEEVEHQWGPKYGVTIEWNLEALRDELDRVAALDRMSREHDNAAQ